MNLHKVKPKCAMDDLILPEEVRTQLESILEEEPYADELLSYGLTPRRKVLLHGPSGCGKTSIAHAVALRLEVPFYPISSAQLFDSHLGSSQKNVAEKIAFATQNRCVVLFDEFDSIAANRGENDSGASRAINAVVNTLLTDLENKEPLGMIFACTNFLDAIDSAVQRRFDAIIEIPSVTKEGLLKIAQSILKDQFGLKAQDVLKQASTPALVAQRAKDMLRLAVVSSAKLKHAKTDDLFEELSKKRKLKAEASQ
jgi:SpoVK/Ycf46/Vps4 family AAA+-type ATPase